MNIEALKVRIELEALISRREALLIHNEIVGSADSNKYGPELFFEIEKEMLELAQRLEPKPTTCESCGGELVNGECQDYGCRLSGNY